MLKPILLGAFTLGAATLASLGAGAAIERDYGRWAVLTLAGIAMAYPAGQLLGDIQEDRMDAAAARQVRADLQAGRETKRPLAEFRAEVGL